MLLKSFLVEIKGIVDVNKDEDLFLQLFSLNFIKINFFLDIFAIQICFNINNDKESMKFFQIIL
jgi:hypothetical protein